MSEIWITLGSEHLKFVDDLALKHSNARARDGSVSLYGAADTFDAILASRRNGYRAEAAVRLWLGPQIEWTITSKAFGKPDFGGFIDVKARKRLHHKLTVKPDADKERAYLLVCTVAHPRYRIVGWCWGYEAATPDRWNDPGTGLPAWWVSEGDPIMKPPEDLREMALSRCAA